MKILMVVGALWFVSCSSDSAVVEKPKATAEKRAQGMSDKGGVSEQLRAHGKPFQKCYEMELKKDLTLQGKLVVQFTIGDEGQVTDTQVLKDGIGSEAVQQCVRDVLMGIQFPNPKGGSVTITNSFVFTSGRS